MGDPWDLTPGVWDQLIDRIHEAGAMASGDEKQIHPAHIQKMKRKARWQKLSEKLM